MPEMNPRRLFARAFVGNPGARSYEFFAGAMAALRECYCGVAIPRLYAPGTACATDFNAGVEEGQRIYRTSSNAGGTAH